jgi:hypothetical protein
MEILKNIDKLDPDEQKVVSCFFDFYAHHFLNTKPELVGMSHPEVKLALVRLIEKGYLRMFGDEENGTMGIEVADE